MKDMPGELMKLRDDLADVWCSEIADGMETLRQCYEAGFNACYNHLTSLSEFDKLTAANERIKIFEQMRKERDKLREALEYIVRHSCSYCSECAPCGSQHKPAARQALDSKGGE